MVKGKASPGKRYCKKCENLIPIHCRVCQFCSTPQYTMLQIKKEYIKRQKNEEEIDEDQDPLIEYHKQILEQNQFFTSLPIFSQKLESLKDFLSISPLNLKVNGTNVTIPEFSYLKHENYFFINPCAKVNCVAFSYSDPSVMALSISNQDLTIGNSYQGNGIIQIWTFAKTPTYEYSLVHSGLTCIDLKFFPAKNYEHGLTLATCLANGDFCIYNIPFSSEFSVFIQPLHVFQISGLIFSCVSWKCNLQVALGTQDGSIFYLSPGFKASKSIFGAHKLCITSISWSPQKNVLASTGLDGYLKLWDESGNLVDSVCLSKRWSYHVSNNPIGNYLFYDIDAAISPHKVLKIVSTNVKQESESASKKKKKEIFKLESIKQLGNSNEATLCSCFSPISSFDYIVSAEGLIESVYVSELEKSSKKRKTPWNRNNKILFQNNGEVFTSEYITEQMIKSSSTGGVKKIDLVVKDQHTEIMAWVGDFCGIYESHFDEGTVISALEEST